MPGDRGQVATAFSRQINDLSHQFLILLWLDWDALVGSLGAWRHDWWDNIKNWPQRIPNNFICVEWNARNSMCHFRLVYAYCTVAAGRVVSCIAYVLRNIKEHRWNFFRVIIKSISDSVPASTRSRMWYLVLLSCRAWAKIVAQSACYLIILLRHSVFASNCSFCWC